VCFKNLDLSLNCSHLDLGILSLEHRILVHTLCLKQLVIGLCVSLLLSFEASNPSLSGFNFGRKLFLELLDLLIKLSLGYFSLSFDALPFDIGSFNKSFKLNDLFVKLFNFTKALDTDFFLHFDNLL